MPLVKLDSIEPLFVCPRCRHSLDKRQGRYHCANAACPYQEKGFSVVEGCPVLVDFEQSILEEQALLQSAGASVIHRTDATGLRKRLKEVVVAPNRAAKQNIETLIQLLAEHPGPLVLVIGGGVIGSGTEALYESPRISLLGSDIYRSPLTQFIADGHQIPLADSSVDAVVIQAVLEHVLDPFQVVAEIVRVLKPGGLVYADTPFLQQVHEGPYDFTRFTESGHRYLFKRFERIASGPVGGPGSQLIWSLEYLARSLFRSRNAGKITRVLFFWLRWLDRLVPAPYAVDAANGVYFLGRKSERAVHPKEMVPYYQGAQRKLLSEPRDP